MKKKKIIRSFSTLRRLSPPEWSCLTLYTPCYEFMEIIQVLNESFSVPHRRIL